MAEGYCNGRHFAPPVWKSFGCRGRGGALLKGATLSDDSAVIPEQSATSKAIKWSSTDLDPSIFEFDSANPTRLKVKAAGDYFLAFSSPVIEAVKAGSNRSQVHFFVKKNGGSTPIPHANARSTYIRHDSDHTESSGHMHVLLPSLSANDYIEIFAKSFDTANNTVRIGIASLFLEKIASSRTIFSATGTRTVAGTNLNPDTASPLQWTQDVADSDLLTVTHPAVTILLWIVPENILFLSICPLALRCRGLLHRSFLKSEEFR